MMLVDMAELRKGVRLVGIYISSVRYSSRRHEFSHVKNGLIILRYFYNLYLDDTTLMIISPLLSI